MSAVADVKTRLYQRSGGRCEALLADQCTGWAEHAHHRKLRSRGGNDTVGNLTDICHRCHEYVHSSRGAVRAKDWGWLVHSYADPTEVPLMRLGRWVLLDDEGGIRPVEVTA